MEPLKSGPNEPASVAGAPTVPADERRVPVNAPRRPPPMRVVTKGWWTLREEKVDMEVLKEKADRDD